MPEIHPVTGEPTNAERAQRVTVAFAAYQATLGGAEATEPIVLRDFLTDLMHWYTHNEETWKAGELPYYALLTVLANADDGFQEEVCGGCFKNEPEVDPGENQLWLCKSCAKERGIEDGAQIVH